MRPLLDALAILPHAKVETIPSGCCGMAGAFGYEREHYEVSMRNEAAIVKNRHYR